MENNSTFANQKIMNASGKSVTALAVLPQGSIIVLIIFICLVIVISVLGNTLVLYTLHKAKLVGSVSSHLVVNLAIIDISISILILPTVITVLARRGWTMGNKFCIAAAFIDSLLTKAQVMALLIIGINRYIAVHHPNLYTSRKNRTISKLIVTGAWTYSVLWSIPPVFGWGRYAYARNTLFCQLDWKAGLSFSIPHFLLSFIVPGVAGLVLYICVLRGVFKHVRQVTFNLERSNTVEMETRRVATATTVNAATVKDIDEGSVIASTGPSLKRTPTNANAWKLQRLSSKHSRHVKELNQVTKAFLVIVLTFTVCWIPRGIANIWAVARGRHSVPFEIEICSTVLIFTTCAVNPIVYGFFRSDFRREFKTVLYCWKGTREN